MAGSKTISVQEIKKHNTHDSCWIVVDDNVWDITSFAPNHPGGSAIIYKYAGRDASASYNAIHSPSIIYNGLDSSKLVGQLDAKASSSDPEWLKPPPEKTAALEVGSKPPLETLINSHDFEAVAEKTLTAKTWAFYSSAATDLVTKNANNSILSRIWLRPRILKNVRDVSTHTRMLKFDIDLPFFISPAAMAKLVHPLGEKAMAAAAVNFGIPQCVSTNASYPLKEITSSGGAKNHPFFFQLYVNKDRPQTEKLLKQAESAGISTLILTVDAPIAGKREADERVSVDVSSFERQPMSGSMARNDKKGGGLGRTTGAYVDSSLNWGDLEWLRRVWKGKVVLKGVQTAADAVKAAQYGVDGIMISNHGGRSLDTSSPTILVLLELNKLCPEIFNIIEVFIDGGVRRGTDIIKCLCLGAKAVGMGRPFLYALNYGQEGVEHFIDIIKDEIETTMRMLGVTSLDQLHPGLLNTLDIDHMVPSTYGEPVTRTKAKL